MQGLSQACEARSHSSPFRLHLAREAPTPATQVTEPRFLEHLLFSRSTLSSREQYRLVMENGMSPLAPGSDAGTQYSGSGKPVPRVSGAGAPLTGSYNPQKVYIGNLPDTATLADLEDCFGSIGLCTCSIKRGFGFVVSDFVWWCSGGSAELRQTDRGSSLLLVSVMLGISSVRTRRTCFDSSFCCCIALAGVPRSCLRR